MLSNLMPNNADMIVPRLWLGNYKSSRDFDFIKNNKIEVIVNCTKDLPFDKYDNVYKYRIPVNDDLSNEEIKSMGYWLTHIIPIIEYHYNQKHNILVHCLAGIQRSAIVVLTFIAQHLGLSFDESYQIIKSKRSIAFIPFINFEKSFYMYQKNKDQIEENYDDVKIM